MEQLIMKNFKTYIVENLDSDKEDFVECPSDYIFEIGERVKINPKSKYSYQVFGNKMGNIRFIKQTSYIKPDETILYVEWDKGKENCYYWKCDLLIKSTNKEKFMEKREELMKRKEELRKKYFDIDPYNEENWED